MEGTHPWAFPPRPPMQGPPSGELTRRGGRPGRATATRSAGRRKGCPQSSLLRYPSRATVSDLTRQGRGDGGCMGQEATLGTSTQPQLSRRARYREEKCFLAPSRPPAGLPHCTAVPVLHRNRAQTPLCRAACLPFPPRTSCSPADKTRALPSLCPSEGKLCDWISQARPPAGA